jgi:hypothetical protein
MRPLAALNRARSAGKRLGMPRTTPFQGRPYPCGSGRAVWCARDSTAAEGMGRQGVRDQTHFSGDDRSASLIQVGVQHFIGRRFCELALAGYRVNVQRKCVSESYLLIDDQQRDRPYQL